MEQEITLRDVANYLDNIGIQFLATIGLDAKPKVRPMQYMVVSHLQTPYCPHEIVSAPLRGIKSIAYDIHDN